MSLAPCPWNEAASPRLTFFREGLRVLKARWARSTIADREGVASHVQLFGPNRPTCTQGQIDVGSEDGVVTRSKHSGREQKSFA